MSEYDFSTGKFNITEMPDYIGATRGLEMHSLDRVGNEGVLIAFAGKSINRNSLEQYVNLSFIPNTAFENTSRD